MLYYCERCGRILIIPSYDKYAKEICDCCDHKVVPVPKEFIHKDIYWMFAGETDEDSEKTKQEFIEKYIKTSPEFNQYYFDHRDELHDKKYAFLSSSSRSYKAPVSNKPKCPYCESANTKRIGALSRGFSIGLFGLASGKIGKQWHCNSCGSDF